MSDRTQQMADAVKRAAGIQSKIARDVFPNGVALHCDRCGRDDFASSAQAATYLSHGWPKHCGETMKISGGSGSGSK